jgi:Tfp pilus assembly protein PilX
MNTIQHNDRRAMFVMSVLACLVLVMLLMTAWLKTIALERGQLRAEQHRMQAEYLAESALSRAAARLSVDPAYDGETIAASEKSLAAGQPATLTIRVEAAPDDAQARLITASAQVPSTGRDRAVRSKQQRILLPSKEQTP